MLRLVALFLVVASGVSVLAAWTPLPPALLAHGFFAAAAMPLMFGAILHFVPVLTRGPGASGFVGNMPWLAALAGSLAVLVLAADWPRPLLAVAAGIAAIAAATVMVWIRRRLQACLGGPHPGARWYLAALAFLLAGMAAAVGMVADPGHFPRWRLLHVHANLFGWIGLTALGTLPVLLPTVAGCTDDGAGMRLRRALWPATAGALLVAAGAALGQGLVAAIGAALLVAVLLGNLRAWHRAAGFGGLLRGASGSLLLAAAFLVILFLAGAVHGLGGLPRAAMVQAFAFGFLLPLVSGALVQLLPVWRFPGAGSATRLRFRDRLGRHAGVRGAVFVAAGGAALAGSPLAAPAAAAGVLAFIVAIAGGWRSDPEPGEAGRGL